MHNSTRPIPQFGFKPLKEYFNKKTILKESKTALSIQNVQLHQAHPHQWQHQLKNVSRYNTTPFRSQPSPNPSKNRSCRLKAPEDLAPGKARALGCHHQLPRRSRHPGKEYREAAQEVQ